MAKIQDFDGVRSPSIAADEGGNVVYSAAIVFELDRGVDKVAIPPRLEDDAKLHLERHWTTLYPAREAPEVLIDADIRDDSEVKFDALILSAEGDSYTDKDGVGELGRYVTERLNVQVMSDNDATTIKANRDELWRAVRVLLYATQVGEIPAP